MISGLIVGILFGFLWKRGKICATGLIRDVYLEKQKFNLVLIFTLIFVQAFVYQLMVGFGVIPPANFKTFPLIAVMLGSFMFGFGAVMCNGCITASLVKLGDGRLTGLVSILAFTPAAYLAKQGALSPITKKLHSIAVVPIPQVQTQPFVLAAVSGVISAYLVYRLVKSVKAFHPKYALPAKYDGFLHQLCEKVWHKETVVVCMALVMAAAFYFSNQNGRNGGFGITGPLLSWLNFIMAGKKIGFASMLVLGIVAGSFIASILTKEFSFLGTNLSSIITAIIGSMLMGIGSIWAQGCLLGNGLVGTAQFSLRSWIGLVFIALGIWTSAYIFIKRTMNEKWHR